LVEAQQVVGSLCVLEFCTNFDHYMFRRMLADRSYTIRSAVLTIKARKAHVHRQTASFVQVFRTIRSGGGFAAAFISASLLRYMFERMLADGSYTIR
jgi:hypothetical protein